MLNKTLFIQPFYFYAGHYFQAFNNFIRNVGKENRYNFLVSVNKSIDNKYFYRDFKTISKLVKIYSFKSASNSYSNMNVFKSFFFILKNRKKYKNFFFYDCKIFIISYLFFFTSFLFKSNYIYIYVYYGPEILNKSKFKNFFFQIFLKKKNTKILLRTKEIEKDWKKKLPYFRNKLIYFKSIDYPNILNINNEFSLKKNNKLKFCCVGQIRNGKSLEFLNNFFKSNNKYYFKIIGSYANKDTENSFKYLEKKFIFNRKFIKYDYLINITKKFDYIILLYDNFFDKRLEVTSLHLAAKLNIPVICFKDNSWLSKKVSLFNCGMAINNLSEFKNFPKRNSDIYKLFQKNLKKFSNSELNLNSDILRLEKLL